MTEARQFQRLNLVDCSELAINQRAINRIPWRLARVAGQIAARRLWPRCSQGGPKRTDCQRRNMEMPLKRLE